MRLDKWLKVSRLIKRRTVAGAVCDDGRVLIGDRVAKSHSEVKPGDRLTLFFAGKRLDVTVLAVPDAPVSVQAATSLYRVEPANHDGADTFALALPDPSESREEQP